MRSTHFLLYVSFSSPWVDMHVHPHNLSLLVALWLSCVECSLIFFSLFFFFLLVVSFQCIIFCVSWWLSLKHVHKLSTLMCFWFRPLAIYCLLQYLQGTRNYRNVINIVTGIVVTACLTWVPHKLSWIQFLLTTLHILIQFMCCDYILNTVFPFLPRSVTTNAATVFTSDITNKPIQEIQSACFRVSYSFWQEH